MSKNWFYDDCVIHNIVKLESKSDNVTCEAIINDRKAQKVTMIWAAYEYLTGVGKGSRNRVYFTGTSKELGLVALRNDKGQLLIKMPSKEDYFMFCFFLPGGVTVLLLMCTTSIIMSLGAPFSVLIFLVIFGLLLKTMVKRFKILRNLSNPDRYPAGSVDTFTSEIFGMPSSST